MSRRKNQNKVNLAEQNESNQADSTVMEKSDQELLKETYTLTQQLAITLEKSRIREYNELLLSPRRLIWNNLLGGMARGVGIAIGLTVITATLLYFLQMLGALNLPIIGDYIADIVRIVQKQLDSSMY